MRLARKLFLLAAMALAALAMTAGSASAQIAVHNEDPADPDCGTVTAVAGHQVTGGCHIEFESTGTGIPLFAYIPARTQLSNCEVHLEGQVGENGEGYVTNAILDAPHGGATPCTRAACDELNGEQLRWPFHIREHGPGNEEVEATFCLRTIASGPGGLATPCEVHLEFTETAQHQYEIGHGTPETFCENSPPNPEARHPTLPFPVSIEAHLVTHPGGETVEVVH